MGSTAAAGRLRKSANKIREILDSSNKQRANRAGYGKDHPRFV
jgi:hypothetical protein